MQTFRELGRDIFGGELGRSRGAGGLNFLLRDDFLTDAAAPLSSPRTAEPGPGTPSVHPDMYISGQALVIGGATNVNRFYTGSSLDFAAGRTVVVRQLTGGVERSGWKVGATVYGFALSGSVVTLDSISVNAGVPASIPATYVVARNQNRNLFIRNSTLYWVDVANKTDALEPYILNFFTEERTYDFIRVLDLPAPFNTDYGLATQRLAGARATGDTFTHEADCVIEYTVTNAPTTGSGIDLHFRQQDTNNQWIVRVGNTGDISLRERIDGAASVQRAISVGVIATGHRIVIVCEGATIRVYSNNVLRFTYSNATTLITATAGVVSAPNTDGVFSDLISWPRVLSGAAAAALNAAVA